MTGSFSALLRGFRQDRGFTQRELGEKGGCDASTICHFENGTRKPSSRDDVLRLAQALRLRVHETNHLLVAAEFAPLRIEATGVRAGTTASADDVEDALRGCTLKVGGFEVFLDKLHGTLLGWVADPGRITPETLRTEMECLLPKACRVLDPTMTNVNRACVFLLSQDRQELRVRYHTGLDVVNESEIKFLASPGPDGSRKSEMGLAGLVFVTGETQLIRDVNQDPRFRDHPLGVIGPYKSTICAPLVSGGECLGVLSIDSHEDIFAPIDRRLVALMARDVAVLLRLAFALAPLAHLEVMRDLQ